MVFGWERLDPGAPMVSLRGPALGPLISLLKTSSLSSRLHLDTIRPDLRQSSQDLTSLLADCLSTKWKAYARFGARASWIAINRCSRVQTTGRTERVKLLRDGEEEAKVKRKKSGIG